MRTSIKRIVSGFGFVAAASALAAPANAATWTITNGSLDAGNFGIGAYFDGTIDFDESGITAWNISVTRSDRLASEAYNTETSWIYADDNKIAFRTRDAFYSSITFANISLQNPNSINVLTGNQSFCTFRGCEVYRNITGGTATLSGYVAPGAVPESATWAMMILGMGAVAWPCAVAGSSRACVTISPESSGDGGKPSAARPAAFCCAGIGGYGTTL